ncbi:MAG: hypothetical protein CM15mP18_0670 [Methanobacteriota archaeon]|nr:MAG: hypothetical protein CM15mP18_0670 [Euryarchaeota archaeon]
MSNRGAQRIGSGRRGQGVHTAGCSFPTFAAPGFRRESGVGHQSLARALAISMVDAMQCQSSRTRKSWF